MHHREGHVLCTKQNQFAFYYYFFKRLCSTKPTMRVRVSCSEENTLDTHSTRAHTHRPTLRSPVVSLRQSAAGCLTQRELPLPRWTITA